MSINTFNRNKHGSGTCITTVHNKIFLDKQDEMVGGINKNSYQSTTGVIEWTNLPGNGLLRINALDATKFDMAGGVALLVDRTDPENPVISKVTWPETLGTSATYLTTNAGTFLGINLLTGAIVQQVTDFTKAQVEYIARIGRLGHFNRVAINQVFDFPLVAETNLDLAHFIMSLGVVKTSGLVIEGNVSDLSLKRNLGTTMRVGAGETRAIQNTPVTPEDLIIDILPAYCDGGLGTTVEALTTQIDTDHYDDCSGTLHALGNNTFGNIYIYFFPYKTGNTTFMLYGNAEYAKLSDAITDLNNVTIRNDIAGGIVLAGISFKKGITNIPSALLTEDAKITNFGMVGIGAGAGTSVGVPSGLVFGVTDVDVIAYNLLLSDQILHHKHSLTAGSTIEWKSAQMVRGRTIFIKDAGGNASVNNITLNTEGAETIDGAGSMVINTDYGYAQIYCDGTNLFVSNKG
jgi:hypothetical protein